MPGSNPFLCGIIEGFYGRQWSFEVRLAYARYLASAGLDACIHCPKSDPYLRRRWQEDWPPQRWRELRELAATYRSFGVAWGVGLSPFALYLAYGPAEREQLRRKIMRLAELDAPLLAVLFDDMPGDADALASRQAAIVADIVDWTGGQQRLLVCPTYYSFDPVLERYFGRRPADYWEQLGKELPNHVGVFWTGNEVCSESIAAEDVREITRRLRRPVTLWDNYPVNDGPERSNYLYTSPLSGRSPALGDLLEGHFCNPMNQALLSLPALSGLAHLYGRPGLCDESLEEALGAAVMRRLQVDGPLFEQEGLRGLGDERRRQLAARYEALPGVAAMEIAAWLRGEYSFDPACLTD